MTPDVFLICYATIGVAIFACCERGAWIETWEMLFGVFTLVAIALFWLPLAVVETTVLVMNPRDR